MLFPEGGMWLVCVRLGALGLRQLDEDTADVSSL